MAEPVSTITASDHNALVAASLASSLYTSNTCGGEGDWRKPLKTILTAGHTAEVRAFLMKYYGDGGQHQDARDPLHTVTTKDRIGLVTVAGELYQIADIGMRMLTARERFDAQGFPPGYIIDLDVPRECERTGKTVMKRITGDQQGRMVGNSVSPPVACALAAANYRERTLAPPEPVAFALEAAE